MRRNLSQAVGFRSQYLPSSQTQSAKSPRPCSSGTNQPPSTRARRATLDRHRPPRFIRQQWPVMPHKRPCQRVPSVLLVVRGHPSWCEIICTTRIHARRSDLCRVNRTSRGKIPSRVVSFAVPSLRAGPSGKSASLARGFWLHSDQPQHRLRTTHSAPQRRSIQAAAFLLALAGVVGSWPGVADLVGHPAPSGGTACVRASCRHAAAGDGRL
jgi:hypothetical protein